MSNKTTMEIETCYYPEDTLKTSDTWRNKLQTFFPLNYIEDLTDFNYSTCFTYIIALDERKQIGLSGLKMLLKKDDVYFIEVLISNVKPLMTIHFFKYPKGSNGQVLETSEHFYLEKHAEIYKKCIAFANSNNLKVLNDNELKIKVAPNNKSVNVYYKYFNQEGENPLELPY